MPRPTQYDELSENFDWLWHGFSGHPLLPIAIGNLGSRTAEWTFHVRLTGTKPGPSQSESQKFSPRYPM